MESCSDVYPVMLWGDLGEQGGFGGRDDAGSVLIPVKAYISQPRYISVSTRAASSGPLDADDDASRFRRKYHDMQLSTWAFRCTTDNTARHSQPASLTATMPADEYRDDCLVSAADASHGGMLTRLVDSWPDGTADGQLMYFYNDEAAAEPVTLYYDSSNMETGYNFFACVTDGAAQSAWTATDSEISRRIEIDGTNDIMAGSAPEMNIQLMQSLYSDESHQHLTSAERAAIASMGGYTAYASRRGVDPQIDLKHQLARLRFKAFPGNYNSQGITITGIKIYSHRTGVLVAAASNPDNVGIIPDAAKDTLHLRDASADGVHPCLPFEEKTLEWREDEAALPATQRTSTRLGADLLLMSDESYDMFLDYRQLIGDKENSDHPVMQTFQGIYHLTPPRTAENKDEARDAYVFKPGYVYDIGIIVYGLERIEVTSSIETWKDGGDISGELDE